MNISTNTEEPMDVPTLVFADLDVSTKLKKEILKHIKQQIIPEVQHVGGCEIADESEYSQGSYIMLCSFSMRCIVCNNMVPCSNRNR